MMLTELLDELRVPYRRHGESAKVTEGWIGLECPYCGHGPFYLGVNLWTGWTTCWACGGHNLARALSDVSGRPVKDMQKLVGRVEHDRRPVWWRPEERGKLVLPDHLTELLPAHRRYLERRGFDPDEVAELWRVQGVGIGVRLRWRLFIPIHWRDEVVSWTSRSIGDVPLEQRYRAARRDEEVYPRRNLVYGIDKCLHAVVIFEGPTDVWAVGPGAVCTCGTGFSQGQVRKLARFPVRAVCFNSEPAAQRRARQLADALSPFPGDTFVVQLSGNDAASSPAAERREIRRRFLD